MLDLIYPIGSLYLSINNTNPETFFGGTWERLSSGYALWTDGDTAGGTIEAGIPNIYGRFSFTDNNDTSMRVRVAEATGAFCSTNYNPDMVNSDGTPNQGYVPCVLDIDASRCNAVYGKSSTVQPPAIKVAVFKRIS